MMVIRKSLDLFCRHRNCHAGIKIHVADAVLRSKLLYGLEPAELIPSVLKQIEKLQLQVRRQILQLNTAYIDRDTRTRQFLTKQTQTKKNMENA